MKIVKLMIIALCVLVGANTVSAQKLDKKANKEAEVTFKTSIDCHNCEQKVLKNIPFEKGVKDVKVTLETKEVKIKFQTGKTNKETLKKAIEKLGYTAEEVTAETAAITGGSCCQKTENHAHSAA